jgi:hypothetical protein
MGNVFIFLIILLWMNYIDEFLNFGNKISYAKSLKFDFDKNLKFVDYVDVYRNLFSENGKLKEIPDFKPTLHISGDFSGFVYYNKKDAFLYFDKGKASYVQKDLGNDCFSQIFTMDNYSLHSKVYPEGSFFQRRAKFEYDNDFFGHLEQKGPYNINFWLDGGFLKSCLCLDLNFEEDSDSHFYIDELNRDLGILEDPLRLRNHFSNLIVDSHSFIQKFDLESKRARFISVSGWNFGDAFDEFFDFI